MNNTLTQGKIGKGLLAFSAPMILGNLLQQLYNVADTLIVGRVLGATALSAVGSAYALMVLLTSVVLGLCMGSGVVFARYYAGGQAALLRSSIFNAAVFIGACAGGINLIAYAFLSQWATLLNVPHKAVEPAREYLGIVFAGFLFVAVFNFFAALLRSMGNSRAPLLFLGIAAVMNIVLDLVFVTAFSWGVAGAAYATVLAQMFCAVCISVYACKHCPLLRLQKEDLRLRKDMFKLVMSHATLTAVQQSIMNFGILMVQSLVNSFGMAVSAAFAVVVKIDAFAYMPAQDFGNAFATFVAQNHGAKNVKRIQEGTRVAVKMTMVFCLLSSLFVNVFAELLLLLFLKETQGEIIAVGKQYLRIEGAMYVGIGLLFVLYGLYRGLGKPGMSIVLTVLSLGSRVALAYGLSAFAAVGVVGIWWAVPIGWAVADLTGVWYYHRHRKTLLTDDQRGQDINSLLSKP